MSDQQVPPQRSLFADFAERLLVGTVESIARALAKGAESLASDAKKVLQREATKAEMAEHIIEGWRKAKLGEVDDTPSSLKEDR